MLPVDARQRAGSFYRLSEAGKEGILKAIEQVSPDQQDNYMKGVLRAGGVEADFVGHVIGHPSSKSPNNKVKGPVQTK